MLPSGWLLVLKRYPGDLGVLPWLASAASGTKGVSLFGSTLAMLVLAAMCVVRR